MSSSGNPLPFRRWLGAAGREIRIPLWRELLFGEWALSRSVWAIQSALGVAILAVRLRELGLVSDGYGVTLVVGPVGSGVVLWLASRTVLRNRSSRAARPWLVVVVWLVADVFRGLGAAGLGVVPLSPVTVAANTAFSVLWTGIFTYLLASSQFFRERSRQMADVIDETARYDERKESMLHQERARLLLTVQDELLPSLVALREDLAVLPDADDRRSWLMLAERVGGLILERVRSVSRAAGLAGDSPDRDREETQSSPSRWRAVLDDAMTADVSVSLSLVLFLSGGLLILIPRVGSVGYAFLGCVAVCSLPLLMLGRWVVGRIGVGWRRATALPIVFLVVALLVGRLSSWFPGSLQVDSSVALEGAIAAFATLTGVVASLVRQHQRRWEATYAAQVDALQRFEAMRSDLDREHLIIQRQMSHLLHGPVQGNLAALTLALRVHAALPEKEFRAGRAVVAERALRLVDTSLDTLREILDEPEMAPVSVVGDLDLLTRAWRGLIAIDVSVSPQARDVTALNPDLARTTLRIVEEGITNASRHGDARHVNVRIALTNDEQLEVLLDNDGRSLAPNFHAGYGLASIDAAGGHWSLGATPRGHTRLTAVVPIVG